MSSHYAIDLRDSLPKKIKQETLDAARHIFDLLVSELGCDGGSLRSVEEIVAECNVSVELVGTVQDKKHGHTLLHVALQEDSCVDIVRFLTNMSSAMLFVNNNAGHNAVHYAVLLHDIHEKTYKTRLQRANERYKALHSGVLATFMLAGDRRLAQKEARFCTLPSARALTAFTGLDGDLLHDVLLQMHASKLSDTVLLANLHSTTCFLAEQSAKLYSTKYTFSTRIIRDAIHLQCAPSIIEQVILCNPSALHVVESRDMRQTQINDGGMPLHFAVAHMRSDSPYNLEVLRVLLKWNPAASFFTGDDQIQQPDMNPALNSALKSKLTGKIVELLVSQHPLVVNQVRMNGRTQLHIELGISNITLGQMQSMVRHASRDTLLAKHMQTQYTPLQMAFEDIYNHICTYGLVILRQLIAACPDALCMPSICFETMLIQVCHVFYQQEGIDIYMHMQMLELIRLMAAACPQLLFITDNKKRRPLELMLPHAEFSPQHETFRAQVESTLQECEHVASREDLNTRAQHRRQPCELQQIAAPAQL